MSVVLSMPDKRVTLKAIARDLDLSVQAVSLALRGRRGVSDATRELVRAKAAELGYRPDPALQSLAAYRTKKRTGGGRWGRVALVHDWKSQEAWGKAGYSLDLRRALHEVAAERNVQIEETWLGHRSEDAARAFRRIHYRGITGLVIAPHVYDDSPTPVPIPANRFQVVTCGPEHLYPQFLTVQFDFYENLRIAWGALWEKGYRRIGLVEAVQQRWRTGYAWEGAYHIEKQLAGCEPHDLPPLCLDDTATLGKRACQRWIRQQRLDAVITSLYQVHDWATEVNPSLFIAEMNTRRPDRPGVALDFRAFCHCLLDSLFVVMQHSLTDQPSFPYRVYVPGSWRDAEA